MAPSEKRERQTTLDLPAPVALAELDGLDVLAEDVLHLDETYWDTSDLALLSLGHTLGHRHGAEGEARWVLELPAPSREGIGRPEWTFDGDSRVVPTAVRALLAAITGGAPFRPVATIATTRTTRRFRDRSTGACVDVVDDLLQTRRDGVVGPAFRQVDIRTIGDHDDAMVRRITKMLARSGAEPLTKEDALRRVAAATAVDATPVDGTDGTPQTASDLVRAALTAGVGQLLEHDVAIRVAGDVEAIHRARIATRHLRSDLKSLEKVLQLDRAEALRAEIGWLAGLLGAVRDLDVIGKTIRDARDSSPPAPPEGVAALESRLAEQRALAHLTLVDAMSCGRYLGLVDRLQRARREPPMREDGARRRAEPTVREAVRRAYRRVEKSVDSLPPQPTDLQLHELRKRVKRARYTAELAAPLTDEHMQRFAKRLTKLQAELGHHQDVVVARAWLERIPLRLTTPDEAFVIGQLTQHLTRAERESSWRRKWRRAQRLRPR
jgi:CHAD domain-containing protein